MTTTTYISNLKSTTSKPIQFYAYYWGRFKLISIHEQDGHAFFAEAASKALEFKLSTKDGKIYLHETDVEPLLLTDKIETLFQNPKEYPKGLLYDNRPSLAELYTKEQMYKSSFRDPEDFEEVEAYRMLLERVDSHFNKFIDIQSIKAEEEGAIKRITLSTSMAQLEIKIQKELFDMEAIHGLNRMLSDLGHEKTLHLTIDPQMYMVILLLSNNEFEAAARIGLIV